MAGWRGKRPLRVARIPGLFDQPLETLGLEINRLAHYRQLTAALVQVVIVGVDALRMCHTFMFGTLSLRNIRKIPAKSPWIASKQCFAPTMRMI